MKSEKLLLPDVTPGAIACRPFVTDGPGKSRLLNHVVRSVYPCSFTGKYEPLFRLENWLDDKSSRFHVFGEREIGYRFAGRAMYDVDSSSWSNIPPMYGRGGTGAPGPVGSLSSGVEQEKSSEGFLGWVPDSPRLRELGVSTAADFVYVILLAIQEGLQRGAVESGSLGSSSAGSTVLKAGDQNSTGARTTKNRRQRARRGGAGAAKTAGGSIPEVEAPMERVAVSEESVRFAKNDADHTSAPTPSKEEPKIAELKPDGPPSMRFLKSEVALSVAFEFAMLVSLTGPAGDTADYLQEVGRRSPGAPKVFGKSDWFPKERSRRAAFQKLRPSSEDQAPPTSSGLFLRKALTPLYNVAPPPKNIAATLTKPLPTPTAELMRQQREEQWDSKTQHSQKNPGPQPRTEAEVNIEHEEFVHLPDGKIWETLWEYRWLRADGTVREEVALWDENFESMLESVQERSSWRSTNPGHHPPPKLSLVDLVQLAVSPILEGDAIAKRRSLLAAKDLEQEAALGRSSAEKAASSNDKPQPPTVNRIVQLGFLLRHAMTYCRMLSFQNLLDSVGGQSSSSLLKNRYRFDVGLMCWFQRIQILP